VRDLRARGVSIIYISHALEESLAAIIGVSEPTVSRMRQARLRLSEIKEKASSWLRSSFVSLVHWMLLFMAIR